MRILVTGGIGIVGTGLIKELRARGHHVVSCDLHHQPDEVGFSLRTDLEVPLYARCDVGEFRQIERVFERLGPFDLVYHTAAEFGRWNGEDFYETLWRTNAVAPKILYLCRNASSRAGSPLLVQPGDRRIDG
jgi:dTDP-glucose 4,6-dehydratase